MTKRYPWLLLLPLLLLGLALTGCLGDDDDDGGSSHTLTVQNNSSHTVWYLYVSPVTDDYWGSDVLGSSVISPGGSFDHEVRNCGQNHDMRAEDSGSGFWQRWDVAMPCDSSSTWTLVD
ncbi:hypothetical protein [Natronospira bacteriovora]|uniref:Uncharacterized protein n=1 Tax=Natronospira bacteriovora TaxID=3069753 RepID=A0ABU0W4Q2_9GAMM|nr:hypothetical protein [Natronospira sp. AB-CW4]MDQ2068888.1 hypothetical protein [Natronospira sp. AB-CW4]